MYFSCHIPFPLSKCHKPASVPTKLFSAPCHHVQWGKSTPYWPPLHSCLPCLSGSTSLCWWHLLKLLQLSCSAFVWLDLDFPDPWLNTKWFEKTVFGNKHSGEYTACWYTRAQCVLHSITEGACCLNLSAVEIKMVSFVVSCLIAAV